MYWYFKISIYWFFGILIYRYFVLYLVLNHWKKILGSKEAVSSPSRTIESDFSQGLSGTDCATIAKTQHEKLKIANFSARCSWLDSWITVKFVILWLPVTKTGNNAHIDTKYKNKTIPDPSRENFRSWTRSKRSSKISLNYTNSR